MFYVLLEIYIYYGKLWNTDVHLIGSNRYRICCGTKIIIKNLITWPKMAPVPVSVNGRRRNIYFFSNKSMISYSTTSTRSASLLIITIVCKQYQ